MTEMGYQPHYRRIERALRERITALHPGERLPSDAQLQEEFGVSRMTARNAMQRLAEEGLVAREPGRGSFVAEPPAHRRANRLMTFTHEMRRRGLRPTSELIERKVRPATADEATSLAVATGSAVAYVRRLRCANELPIAIEASVLIGACAEMVMSADLEGGSLHQALARGGVHLRHGSGTIAAGSATLQDARWLQLHNGDPLLVERRVISDTDGRRIESTESRYAADRYAIDVDFEVEAPGAIEPDT